MKRLTVAATIAVMAVGIFTGCGNRGIAPLNNSAGNTVENQSGQSDIGQSGQSGQTGQGTGGATTQGGGTAAVQDIGEVAALQAALGAAGVGEAEATRIKTFRDRDDGRIVYDVRFDVGQTQYDYEILASDGQIISSDVEQVADARYNTGMAYNANVPVSLDQAISTALSKVSGATENDIRIKLDFDDGRYKYEGDIIYNRIEYDFEIDANTGEVIGWSEERS